MLHFHPEAAVEELQRAQAQVLLPSLRLYLLIDTRFSHPSQIPQPVPFFQAPSTIPVAPLQSQPYPYPAPPAASFATTASSVDGMSFEQRRQLEDSSMDDFGDINQYMAQFLHQ